MKMLSTDGESFSEKKMANKIVYKNLYGKERVEYVKKGGKSLTTMSNIIDIIEEIEEALEVEREVEYESRRNNRNRNNDHNGSNNGNNNSNNGSSGGNGSGKDDKNGGGSNRNT